MEHPSKYDFFLKFKALFDNEDKFIDYILINVSDNFQNAFGIKPEMVIGKRILEIISEYDTDMFGINDTYYSMIPKTRRKFERYIKGLDKWYLINIFSDERDYLMLFYNDISRIKRSTDKTSDYMADLYDIRDKFNRFGYKDRLTGLYTREFFEEELFRLDSERQLPISVINGDLNGLKLINDAFGHDMGDKALKRVAELMRMSFRKEDIVSRIGGDEFLALLPKTSEKTALKIVERIKKLSEANPLNFLKISISFGVATKTNTDEDIMQIQKKAEDRMYFNKLKESKDAKHTMIKYLKDKLEEISFETKSHYDRLRDLSFMLAEEIGISSIEKEELRLLCEFHDIGKIGVSPKILQKKEALNEEEWESLKRHSEIGYHIIGASKENCNIDELILVHHERWDGSGYPGLLKNDEIPLTARIFAIADAYEAMVNDRPYRERLTVKEALEEIKTKAGTQFDPYLAKKFVKLMEKEKKAI